MASVFEIISAIQKKAGDGSAVSKRQIVSLFPTQAPLVSYALSRMVKEGLLVKRGSTRGATYVLSQPVVSGTSVSKTYIRGKQSEDEIFREMQDVFLKNQDIGESARSIVPYAFTEMVNNAIDHSESETVDVTMSVRAGKLRFTVRDHGIGAFRKVKEARHLPDERAALAEITKGKVTTAPQWHSGQGIFFVSRAADLFRLTSGSLTMERNNLEDGVVRAIDNEQRIEGTLVEFEVDVHTNRSLTDDVFGKFETDADEHDFSKTEVEIALFDRGDVHVSRSQAKRLVAGLEKFSQVTLDFAGVPFIGQGFADQIFRIFVRDNPQTKLIVKNAVPAVQMMIDRVDKP